MTPIRQTSWPVMFRYQQQRFHRGLPFLALCSARDSLVMYTAASRSVSSGFRPGTVIGSENR
jgi:hypothetical protein